MNEKIAQQIKKNLVPIIQKYSELKSKSAYSDFSDIELAETSQYIAMARAAVERCVGVNSPYMKQLDDLFKNFTSVNPYIIQHINGIINAIKADVDAGNVQSIIEFIHADMFADFLDMAKYLLEEGYKDASAVITGSALEEHLRKLCEKNLIDTKTTDSTGKAKHKKADTINADLRKADLYNVLDQKNITSWLDLRNKAAHGEYNEYTKEQVALQLSGVSEFIARVSA